LCNILLVWNMILLSHFNFPFNPSFIFYQIYKLWIILLKWLFMVTLFDLLINIRSCRLNFFCNLVRLFCWCTYFDFIILWWYFIVRNTLDSSIIKLCLNYTIFLFKGFLILNMEIFILLLDVLRHSILNQR
jgi:hypothetical protein